MIDVMFSIGLGLIGSISGVLFVKALGLSLAREEELVLGVSLAFCIIPLGMMFVNVLWSIPPSRAVFVIVSALLAMVSLVACVLSTPKAKAAAVKRKNR